MSKKYRPIIKEGTHLASSKNTDGTYLGALLDNETNKVVGQAEWEMVEEVDDWNWNDPYEYSDNHEKVELSKETQEMIEVLGMAFAVLGIHMIEIGVKKATPYVKQFVTDKVVPSVNKTMSWIAEKSATGIYIIRNGISGKTKAEQLLAKRTKIKSDNTELSATNNSTVELPENIDNTFEDTRESMSREEAQQHLIYIKALAILLADEIRKLSNACIREDNESPKNILEQQTAIEKLTTQEVMNSIKLLLEKKNRSLLDEATSMVLSEFLAGNLIIDGTPVPIEKYRIPMTFPRKAISGQKQNEGILELTFEPVETFGDIGKTSALEQGQDQIVKD